MPSIRGHLNRYKELKGQSTDDKIIAVPLINNQTLFMKNPVYVLVQTFIKHNGYKIDPKELEFQLLSHPTYPSLHSITGVLDHFGFGNMALELPLESDILSELPKSFMAVSNLGQYMLVEKYKNQFKLLIEDGRNEMLSNDEFLDYWNGVVLGIENDAHISSNKKPVRKIPKYTLAFFVLVILSVYIFYFNQSTFAITHFSLGIVGLLLSILIFYHELGFQSKALDRICTVNKVTNCDAVLQSKGAKLFGNIKLSAISLIYFSGITLTWFLNSLLGLESGALILITILSLPITFFSVYYQYKIVKQWCPLCLGVIAVLWGQNLSILIKGINEFSLYELTVLMIGILIATSILIPVQSFLFENQSLKNIKIDHYKFKRNFNVFLSFLKVSKTYRTEITKYVDNEISLGSNDALLEIVLLTNPQCFYCKAAHSEIKRIINKNPTEIHLIIRFNISSQDTDQIGFKVCCRLLELYNSNDYKKFIMALDDAYMENRDLEQWLNKWKHCTNVDFFKSVLIEQREWCSSNAMPFTPKLFINGKEYPNEYEIGELRYFIDELWENINEREGEKKEFIPMA